jgi:predicted SAM-dependent methyltransferase
MKIKYLSVLKRTILNLISRFDLILLRDKFYPEYSNAVVDLYGVKTKLINIGAGNFYHPLWINMDYQNDFYGDVQHKNFVPHDLSLESDFPFGNNDIDAFYCSHVIEHLSDAAVNKLLSEVYRCLKPGGCFRLVVPDMGYLYEDFKNGGDVVKQISPWGGSGERHKCFIEHFATLLIDDEQLCTSSILTKEAIENSIKSFNAEDFFRFYSDLLPINANKLMPHGHCNWFTFSKLTKMLKVNGFSNPYRSEFGKSSCVAMRSLKLFDNTSPEISLYVEVYKY